MSQVYRDSDGHFISRRKYYRIQERRLLMSNFSGGVQQEKKSNYSWIAWLALGAFGVSLLAIFI